VQPDPEIPDRPPPDDSGEIGLPRLVVLAVVGGVMTGLLGGAFRLTLVEVGRWWESLLVWARDLGGWRLTLPVLGAALAVALARLIVRWSPESSGSGVQRVEALMRHEVEPAPLRVVPAKFAGGALAIGVGMALGREGPTVQMGASVGGEIARRARLDPHDTRTLSASLAGAGLGVAFSAPLGGAVFVLEELARAIRTRLVVATLVAGGVALGVALPLVGTRPVLPVPAIEDARLWHLAFYAPMGLLIGWLGIHYNRLVIWNLNAMDRVRLPPEVKAGAIGALVGGLGVAAPWLVGGGEILADRVLTLGLPFGALVLTLVVRPAAGGRGVAGVAHRDGVQHGIAGPGSARRGVRDRRHVDLLRRGGARPADGHRAVRRDDGHYDRAGADDGGRSDGDGPVHGGQGAPDLRLPAASHGGLLSAWLTCVRGAGRPPRRRNCRTAPPAR
jgi:CIC family chloride channel protein